MMQRTRAREILLACAFVFCGCKTKQESVAGAASASPSVSATEALPALTASSESPEDDANREVAHRAALREAVAFGMLDEHEVGRELDRVRASKVNGPSVVVGRVRVGGQLPPDVIRGMIRDHSGEYRRCYEDGLKRSSALRGRVTAKFVIDENGLVRGEAEDAGSDLPDQSVVQCVLRAFSNLSYPQPERGVVIVVVPLLFSPP